MIKAQQKSEKTRKDSESLMKAMREEIHRDLNTGFDWIAGITPEKKVTKKRRAQERGISKYHEANKGETIVPGETGVEENPGKWRRHDEEENDQQERNEDRSSVPL